MTTTAEQDTDPTITEIRRLIDSIGQRLNSVAEAIDNLPTRTTTLTTMPVAEVPVDGSVEVRPVGGQGRFGPWVHIIGEQERAVGGEENRSLLIDGVPEPFTWHRDMCVQVRPFRPADEDLADARHRTSNGGL